MKPKTHFVIIRKPDEGDGVQEVRIENSERFDFTDYRFLRMGITGKMEEWVHKTELEKYKKLFEKGN